MRLFLVLALVASASAQFGLSPLTGGFSGFGGSSLWGSGLGGLGGMFDGGFGSGGFGGLFGGDNGFFGGNGLFGGMGNGGLFGGFGNSFSPMDNGLGDGFGSVCGCVQNIIQEVAVFLNDVLEDVDVLISQLLNPGLPVSAKVQLIQRIIPSLPLPLQQRVQSLALALMNVANQLQYQPIPIQRAVSQVLSLPFNQAFRRLSPVQQELIIQNTLSGLSQPQVLLVTNILNQFRALVNQGQFGNFGGMGFPGNFGSSRALSGFGNSLSGFGGFGGFGSPLSGFGNSLGGFSSLNGLNSPLSSFGSGFGGSLNGFSPLSGLGNSFGSPLGGFNSFGSGLGGFNSPMRSSSRFLRK